jgi:Sulfatase-modifying factor enzyme 1
MARRYNGLFLVLIGTVLLCGFVSSCFVESFCYNNADCPKDKVCHIEQGQKNGKCKSMCDEDVDCQLGYLCDLATGMCKPADCQNDDDCPANFECEKGRCVSTTPLQCPAGMVPIERQFCIDIYEASRPDSTKTEYGFDNSMAVSKPKGMPWTVSSNAEADEACQNAGKTLCTEDQWFKACSGPDGMDYSYGNTYEPATCNGIDTYCDCEEGSHCQNIDPCPFPRCHSECGGTFTLMPTGSFPGCNNGYGVFDMNGNLWEHVLGGDETRIRGGAYNCLDSQRLHRCDYIPGTWEPSARGFRCCSVGMADEDAGPLNNHGDGGNE